MPRLLPPLLLTLAAAALLLRAPELIAQPRFWAEEGRVYFAHALTGPASSALLAAHVGYYSLVPNLATWLATLVPVERAPAVTTVIALAVQLLPAAIAATSPAPWAGGPDPAGMLRRGAVVAAVVLVGAAGELHATTTNSQFHLAVAAVLVYLDFGTPLPTGRRRLLTVLLLVAGLTGVQSTLLAPVFVWRWWRERRPADAAGAAILGSCLILQAVVVLTAASAPDRFAAGPDAAPLEAAGDLLKGMLIHPIAGGLGPRWLRQPFGGAMFALAVIGVLAAAAAQLAVLRRGPGRDLLAAAWLVAAVSHVGSRRMAGGERYLEAASVLVVLAVLALAFDAARDRRMRAVAGVATAIALTVNAWLYVPRMAGASDPAWPRWREEVAAWRVGERAEPRIHPQWADGGWTVPLPARLRQR